MRTGGDGRPRRPAPLLGNERGTLRDARIDYELAGLALELAYHQLTETEKPRTTAAACVSTRGGQERALQLPVSARNVDRVLDGCHLESVLRAYLAHMTVIGPTGNRPVR